MKAVHTSPVSLLIVEDDRRLSATMGEALEARQYEVDYAHDGLEALALAAVNRYDVILLDLGLPTIDGVETCRRLRGTSYSRGAIIALTGRTTLQDKVETLDAGADDYLIKPFAVDELDARLQALVRRQRAIVAPTLLQVDELVLDQRSGTVRRGETPISLLPIGFHILATLMRASPRVVTRDALIRNVWGHDAPATDSLRSHIYLLRKRVDKGFAYPLLQTLPQTGFRVGRWSESVGVPSPAEQAAVHDGVSPLD